jgi:hypothetical protein
VSQSEKPTKTQNLNLPDLLVEQRRGLQLAIQCLLQLGNLFLQCILLLDRQKALETRKAALQSHQREVLAVEQLLLLGDISFKLAIAAAGILDGGLCGWGKVRFTQACTLWSYIVRRSARSGPAVSALGLLVLEFTQGIQLHDDGCAAQLFRLAYLLKLAGLLLDSHHSLQTRCVNTHE